MVFLYVDSRRGLYRTLPHLSDVWKWNFSCIF